MKKIKSESLTGFGIGCIIVLAAIMIIHFYIKADGQVFYMRILEGAWRFVCVFFGAGLILLVLFFAFYGAAKLSPMIFKDKEKEDDLLDKFMALSNPLLIISFIVAYIVMFFEL